MKCGDDLIRDLIKIMQHALGENTFGENFAEQVSLQLYANWGGEAVYIPKVGDRDARRDAVLREFNGRNRKELCVKYRLSKAQFYRWIKGR